MDKQPCPKTTPVYKIVGEDVSCYAIENTGAGMLVRLMFKDQTKEHVVVNCKHLSLSSIRSGWGHTTMYPSGRFPGSMIVSLPESMTATLRDGYELKLSQTRDI